MHRHQLTDEQWSVVEPLIPKKHARTGRPPADVRRMLDGIMWILRTGAPWRDLPERFGPYQTVYDYYSRWRRGGVFDRVLEALQVRLDRQGEIDWDLWCIDGSHVRAARSAAGAGKKASGSTPRKASRRTMRWAAAAADSAASSTWSLTAAAPPLAVRLTAGQVYEATQAQAVMEQVAIPQPLGRPRQRPEKLAGDKAYRARHIRQWLWKRGIKPVIPRKDNERKIGRPPLFDKPSYRRRSVIENCVGWLKECRRIVTRFEKLAVNYLGMLKLAMIQRYLRLLEFSDRA